MTEMPDMTLGGSPSEPVVAFGDWNAGYRILERTGLTILRDPYTRAMQSTVQFHARRRVGGWLVLGEAVKGLRT